MSVRGVMPRAEITMLPALLFESVRLFYLTPPTSVKNDFNSDGKPDILWRNTATGENAYWYMNGTTIAGSASILTRPGSELDNSRYG